MLIQSNAVQNLLYVPFHNCYVPDSFQKITLKNNLKFCPINKQLAPIVNLAVNTKNQISKDCMCKYNQTHKVTLYKSGIRMDGNFFVKRNLKFNQTHTNYHHNKQYTKGCVVKMESQFSNTHVLTTQSTYSWLSINLTHIRRHISWQH